MPRARPLLAALPLLAVVALASLLIAGRESRAIQAPRISIDMNPAGNAYDANTNTMVTGPIDQCLGSDPPGNNAGHNHVAHLIIHEVEDLVGWQVRLHYDGGRMRPAAANVEPFPDDLRGQGVGFTNLPITDGVHRVVTPSAAIPPAAPGPQSALVGAAYQGTQTFPVSPDTPPQAPPDDTSYAAPAGGVLASLTLQVLPGQAGQPVMPMDLDDASPTAPGSKVVVFDGTTTTTIDLADTAVFDGFHAEGGPCVLPPGVQTPPPTNGGPGGPGGPGDRAGGSPGATNGAGGSPGAGTPGPGATGSPDGTGPDGSPTPTPTPNGAEDDEEDGDASDGGDGGAPVWPFILIAAVAVAAGAAAFAAWRYRSRIPWLRDRFPG